MVRGKTTDIEGGGELDEEDDQAEDRLHGHFSSSTPDIHSLNLGGNRDSGVCDEGDTVQKMVRAAQSVCRVVVDFSPDQHDQSCIPLKVNQKVHVVQESTSDWWYGVCDGRCGYFPPSHVKPIKEAGKLRSTTIAEPSQHLAMADALASRNNINYSLLCPARDHTRTESERSDSSQPESPLLERRNRAKTTLGHIFTAALEGKREGKGHGSGFQSDSGISEESLSNTIQKVIQPSTKQQLLQSKHTPILPPSKSSVSNSRHPPTSPRGADSESTNVDSSDSEDSYEDVMSGDEEESVVKSRWTNNTPFSAESKNPGGKSFILPPMRNKILPSVPDTQPLTSWKTSTTSRNNSQQNNYDDVVLAESNYENITLEAFEIVDDHIYDRVELLTKRNTPSVVYQMTATSAHVKAATQMALQAQSSKQAQQVDRPQKAQDESSDQRSVRWQPHPVRATPEHNQAAGIVERVAMSPKSKAFVPPRDIPRSPLHSSSDSSTGSHDVFTSSSQPRWRAPLSPPHAGLSKVAPKMHEPPIVPLKSFSQPQSPPTESVKFDAPALPPKTPDESASFVPPQIPTRTVTLLSKPLPMLPPKQPPAPPPKTSSLSSAEAPRVPPKTSSLSSAEGPSVPLKTSSLSSAEAPSVPPKTSSLSSAEGPSVPPKMSTFTPFETPELPPKTTDLALVDVPVVRPKFTKSSSLTPAAEPPSVPPKSSNPSTMPAVLPKPGKRGPAVAPIPLAKPSKQQRDVPELPPKAANPHTERSLSHRQVWNSQGDGRSGESDPAGAMPRPAMNLAMILANAHQQGNLASKRYHKY